MLHIRDDAFRALGDTNLRDLKVAGKAPDVHDHSVTDLTPAEDDRIARRVEGTMTVPCYLTDGLRARRAASRSSKQGLPDTTARPRRRSRAASRARRSTRPTRRRRGPSLYGHGLLGSAERGQRRQRALDGQRAQLRVLRHRVGRASPRRTSATSSAAISDFSKFNTVADRMQQGFLNQLLLGRLMIHPQGLASNPAFQKNGRSVIDTRRLFFDGNSQGGIMGGALTAVAPDFNRAVLGVPGHELLDAAAAQRRLRHLRAR